MSEHASILWSTHNFESLPPALLYEILKLRVDVFVVEQVCPYPEIDGLDRVEGSVHLCGHAPGAKEGTKGETATTAVLEPPRGALLAYARLVPLANEQARIGRVVVHPEARGRGLASVMLNKLVIEARRYWPTNTVVLSAQTQALPLYSKLGFEACSGPYLEDGIEHVDMLLPPV